MRRLALLLVIFPTPARAVTYGDQQALPCRPTIACTADVVPPGTAEVEIGYLYRRLGGEARQHSVPVLAKLTLAEWVQLQVGGNGFTAQNILPKRFVDDVVVGFKFHLFDQTKRVPSLSWSVALSAPISSATGFVRSEDLEWIAYITKDVGPAHLDLNVGLNLWALDAAVHPQPWLALAVSFELPRRFTIMAESYYYEDAGAIAPRDAGLLAALAYAPRPWIVLDAGADLGFVWKQRVVSAFVGMTVAPVDFWRSALERRRHPNER